MIHQVLFSMENNEKIFMNVVCCSFDWRFNEELHLLTVKAKSANTDFANTIDFDEWLKRELILFPLKSTVFQYDIAWMKYFFLILQM